MKPCLLEVCRPRAEHPPDLAAFVVAPFGDPPVDREDDSATGAGADRSPPLTQTSSHVGAPPGPSPLADPRHGKSQLGQELLDGPVDGRRVREVGGVPAPFDRHEPAAVGKPRAQSLRELHVDRGVGRAVDHESWGLDLTQAFVDVIATRQRVERRPQQRALDLL